jgi:hypothetical protein
MAKKKRPYCPRCRKYDHHDPACPEMFLGGDPAKPRGVPGVDRRREREEDE